ncbi:reverse transcriptase domain-containing protein [Tanacetum coccineum]
MILFPPLGEEDGTEGPMVIEAEVGGHLVHRMYVDGGASSEILYEHCFNQLRPEIRNQMVPATTYLVGFSGEIIWRRGQVSLLVKIGDEEHSTSSWMNFMVVRSHSPYNGIIGRPGVRRIQGIPSTTHGMLKFRGTVTLRSSRIIPLECAMISGPERSSLWLTRHRRKNSILGEVSSEVRASAEDLEKERGVIMEEYKANRNGNGRMQDTHWLLMMEGSKAQGEEFDEVDPINLIDEDAEEGLPTHNINTRRTIAPLKGLECSGFMYLNN